MRAIGYIRVSTEEQGRAGHSLAMQPERIKLWCQMHGLDLVSVITDQGISAGTALERRKGGGRLLQALDAGEAQVVVVYKLDRLFRDTLDGLLFFRQFAQPRGVVVQSVSELIDTSTPQGQLNLNLQLSLAEYERAVTCERNRAVSAHLRANARPYGTTPYGVLSIDGRLYRDPATWPLRERIVALRTPECGSRRRSLGLIAEMLQAEGIAAPQGGQRWSKHSVSRVIQSHDELKDYPWAPARHEAEVSEGVSP
ncbi:recombinase family protein [Pseudoxanthomonas sp. USHLN014]|uniref:recombinase family protein n=1 Tax=Pseudoxanthomonas sp. USHLN014 TaxID=3081297 RepID=UPI00301DCC4D